MSNFNPVTEKQSSEEMKEVIKRLVFVAAVLNKQKEKRVPFDYVIHPKTLISLVAALDTVEKHLLLKEMLKNSENIDTEGFAQFITGTAMLQFGYELGMLRSEGGAKNDSK